MQTTITRIIENSGGRTISRDLKALYTQRVLARMGFGLTSVFTIALIYQYFNNSFLAVAAVYAGMNIFVFFFTPLSSMLIRKFGVRSMFLMAIPALILSMLGLHQFAIGGTYALYGLVGFSILMGVYKVLYWVPYHIDFSLLLDTERRGSQIALLRNLADLMIVIMPLIGGLIVASLGFEVLYMVAILVIALGIIPIFYIQTAHETYTWSYLQTFLQLFSPRNRSLVLAHFGVGTQNVTLLVIWPLLIFILLESKYVALGIITALTLFAVLVLRLITGNLFDQWNKSKLIIIGAVLASTGWLLKIVVATPFQIFAADAYHGMGRVVNKTSIDAMTYEQSADNGRYVDEYTTLKELSLSAGKISMLAFASVISIIFGLNTAFFASIIIAAAATLTTMLISRHTCLV
jgi:MFS family permease